MIAAPAHAHRVLLHRPQAWHGLAGAGDARAVAGDGAGNGGRRGGHAAQMTQEVQRHAFGAEHRAGVAADAGNLHSRREVAAVALRHRELDAWIHHAKRQARQVQPRQHAVLARHQPRLGDGVGGDDGVRRQVAGAPQVFQQCRAHQRLQHDFR
ncbi:hypothetical protein D3C87_1541630 [compost metagenome]